jgi:hypothetical protein
MLTDTKEWRKGRLGEILQFGVYWRLRVLLEPLADRTFRRAPLLHGFVATITAPDANALKTARFFLEFKTKEHHEQWRGGSPNDNPRVSSRSEEGIDRGKRLEYRRAEVLWKQPVVLSILSITEAEILAATFKQLGEPRRSNHPDYDIDSWDVRQFSRILTFDPDRLRRFFHGKNSRTGQDRWLKDMPRVEEICKMLDWLGASQAEFEGMRQFIFDQIESDWHR